MKRAFSFVEVLIAIICLALVMIPLTTMFSFSSSGTVQNRNDILARQHAANLLDYSYSLPFDHQFLKPGTDRDVPSVSLVSAGEELKLDMESIFTRKISIEEVRPANWKYAYKLIKVKVSWKLDAGKTHKEQVMTGLITNESS